MPDYRELYLNMVRATEEAIRILVKAQQMCEELYISAEEEPLRLFLEQSEREM